MNANTQENNKMNADNNTIAENFEIDQSLATAEELIESMGWIRIGSAINLDHCMVSDEHDGKYVFDEGKLNSMNLIMINSNSLELSKAIGNANSQQNQSAFSLAVGAGASINGAGLAHGGFTAHFEMAKNECKSQYTTTNKFIFIQKTTAKLINVCEENQERYLNCTNEPFRNAILEIIECGRNIEKFQAEFENRCFKDENGKEITIKSILGSNWPNNEEAMDIKNKYIKQITEGPHHLHELYKKNKKKFEQEFILPLNRYGYYAFTQQPKLYSRFYQDWGTGCVYKIRLGSIALVEAQVMWSSLSLKDNYNGGLAVDFGGAMFNAAISTETTVQLQQLAANGKYTCNLLATPVGSAAAESAAKIRDLLTTKSLADISKEPWQSTFEAAKPQQLKIEYPKREPEKGVYHSMETKTAEDCVMKAQLTRLDQSESWGTYKKAMSTAKKPCNDHPNPIDLDNYNKWLKTGNLPGVELNTSLPGDQNNFFDVVIMRDYIKTLPNIVSDSLHNRENCHRDQDIENVAENDPPKAPSNNYGVLGYEYIGYDKLFPKVFRKPLNDLISPTQILGVNAALWIEQELTIIMYLRYCSNFPTWYGIDYDMSVVSGKMLTCLEVATRVLRNTYGRGLRITSLDIIKAVDKYWELLNEEVNFLKHSGIYEFVHEPENYALIKKCPLGLIPVVKSDTRKETTGPWVFFRFRKEATVWAQAQSAYGWPTANAPTASQLLSYDPIRLYPIIHWREGIEPRFVFISQQALHKSENIFDKEDDRAKVYNLLSTPTSDFINNKMDQKWVIAKKNNPFNMGWYADNRRDCLEKTEVKLDYTKLDKDEKNTAYGLKATINGNYEPFFGWHNEITYGDIEDDKMLQNYGRQNPMKYYYVMDPDKHHDKGEWKPWCELIYCELYLIPVNFSDTRGIKNSITGLPMFFETSENAIQETLHKMQSRTVAPDQFVQGIDLLSQGD